MKKPVADKPKQYRTWMFHKTQGKRLFTFEDTEQDRERFEALKEEGWADTPAVFAEEPEPTQDDGMSQAQRNLLEQFKIAPETLNKDQHVELGKGLGLNLMKAWKEETLIAKIQEHLNGDDQTAD